MNYVNEYLNESRGVTLKHPITEWPKEIKIDREQAKIILRDFYSRIVISGGRGIGKEALRMAMMKSLEALEQPEIVYCKDCINSNDCVTYDEFYWDRYDTSFCSEGRK